MSSSRDENVEDQIDSTLRSLWNSHQCRICFDLYNYPVTIKCGHRFCKKCIEDWIGVKLEAKCPLCKERIRKRTVPKQHDNFLHCIAEKVRGIKNAIQQDSGILVEVGGDCQGPTTSTNNVNVSMGSFTAFKKERIASKTKRAVKKVEPNKSDEMNSSQSKVEHWLQNQQIEAPLPHIIPETEFSIEECSVVQSVLSPPGKPKDEKIKKKIYKRTICDGELEKCDSKPQLSQTLKGDWKRVKTLGKEMKKNTIKPLAVRVEKSNPVSLEDEVESKIIQEDQSSELPDELQSNIKTSTPISFKPGKILRKDKSKNDSGYASSSAKNKNETSTLSNKKRFSTPEIIQVPPQKSKLSLRLNSKDDFVEKTKPEVRAFETFRFTKNFESTSGDDSLLKEFLNKTAKTRTISTQTKNSFEGNKLFVAFKKLSKVTKNHKKISLCPKKIKLAAVALMPKKKVSVPLSNIPKRTTIGIKLLSPDKDSQLKFLTDSSSLFHGKNRIEQALKNMESNKSKSEQSPNKSSKRQLSFDPQTSIKKQKTEAEDQKANKTLNRSEKTKITSKESLVSKSTSKNLKTISVDSDSGSNDSPKKSSKKAISKKQRSFVIRSSSSESLASKKRDSPISDDDADVMSILNKWSNKSGSSEQASKKRKISIPESGLIVVSSDEEPPKNALVSEEIFGTNDECVAQNSPIKASSVESNSSNKENIRRSARNLDRTPIRTPKQKEISPVRTPKQTPKQKRASPLKTPKQTPRQTRSSSRGTPKSTPPKMRTSPRKKLIEAHITPEKQKFSRTLKNSTPKTSKKGLYSEDFSESSMFTEKTIREIPKHLLDITQDQLNLKRVEKELLGVDLSMIQNNDKSEDEEEEDEDVIQSSLQNEVVRNSTQGTVKKIPELSKPSQPDEEDEVETENIQGTPSMRNRRSNFYYPSPSSQPLSVLSQKLIEAVTPLKNRKCFPVSHSTPTAAAKKPSKRKLNITTTQLDHLSSKFKEFAEKFEGKLSSKFDEDVTHVVVKTDSNNVGIKTFKYIQGIGFKKWVVGEKWMLDSLKSGTLLDEAKYEVLDLETMECGGKKSRERKKGLFEGFSFICFGKFPFKLKDFQNLLEFNGADVSSSPDEFNALKDSYKVILMGDAEKISKQDIELVKRCRGVPISFEWVVDSISRYEIKSAVEELYEIEVEEAKALGFPEEYLVESQSDPYGSDDEDE